MLPDVGIDGEVCIQRALEPMTPTSTSLILSCSALIYCTSPLFNIVLSYIIHLYLIGLCIQPLDPAIMFIYKAKSALIKVYVHTCIWLQQSLVRTC